MAELAVTAAVMATRRLRVASIASMCVRRRESACIQHSNVLPFAVTPALARCLGDGSAQPHLNQPYRLAASGRIAHA
jgi:hypothetical protein